LSALLLEPLLPHLARARRVFAALDDVLYWIPLDALPLAEGFVGDRYEIVHEVSFLQLLARGNATGARGPSGFLAVGGVDFGSAPRALALRR
jgi:hypothetical protein